MLPIFSAVTPLFKNNGAPNGAKAKAMNQRENRVVLDWMAYHRGDYIVLYASKLAACAGMHRYVPRDVMRSEFLRAVGNLDSYVTPAEAGQAELAGLDAGVLSEVKRATEATYGNASDVATALLQLQERVTLNEAAKTVVRSQMYTKHGKEQEDGIRLGVEAQMKKRIKTCSAFKTCEYPLMAVRGVEVYVGGRHDGVMEDGHIVEIKTRQNRFLGTPVYELVQVHAYMHIYGTRRATLVESYNGERRTHEVEFDDDLWGRVISAVTMFVDDILMSPRTSRSSSPTRTSGATPEKTLG